MPMASATSFNVALAGTSISFASAALCPSISCTAVAVSWSSTVLLGSETAIPKSCRADVSSATVMFSVLASSVTRIPLASIILFSYLQLLCRRWFCRRSCIILRNYLKQLLKQFRRYFFHLKRALQLFLFPGLLNAFHACAHVGTPPRHFSFGIITDGAIGLAHHAQKGAFCVCGSAGDTGTYRHTPRSHTGFESFFH